MPSSHNPFFLYVEDDFHSREVMQILLSDVMGYDDHVVFDNTADFIDRFKILPAIPDLIFVDIQIEPHNGYEVLVMLRDQPQGNDIKVVATTASVSVQEVQQLKAAGFDGLIGKPIRTKVFPQLVTRLLQGEQLWFIP